MSKPDDGGPAFPVFEEHERFNEDRGVYEKFSLPSRGMSLRDYFAGQALAGMLSAGFLPRQTGLTTDYEDCYTRAAYRIADAMLAERAKPPT